MILNPYEKNKKCLHLSETTEMLQGDLFISHYVLHVGGSDLSVARMGHFT